MRIRSLAVIASFAAALLAAPAFAATTYTWNTFSPGGTAFSQSGSGAGNQYTFTWGTESVKVRAYSLDNLTSATFQTATVGLYDHGLGVTYQGESTTSPNHALDNVGKFDFLLVEFDGPTSNLGFQIGWKNGSTGDTDVQVYVGTAAAGLNLTSNGACGGSCDFTELGLLGFGSAQTFDNVALDTTKNVSGQGRYLLISGRLTTDLDDYFKVSLLTGSQSTSVPEPSSLAIMAVAAAGFGFARRRRRAA
jgi:hypothetical protein